MTAVFIGGSRRVSQLSDEVRRRLDSIMDKALPVFVGDANGADKAVQTYLREKAYGRVEVFCTDGKCRNNIGGWQVRSVTSGIKKRAFLFRTAKDKEMARLATVGMMIWDGASLGTMLNTLRLVQANKKVVVYVTPTHQFVNVSTQQDLDNLVSIHAPSIRPRLYRESESEMDESQSVQQLRLA